MTVQSRGEWRQLGPRDTLQSAAPAVVGPGHKRFLAQGFHGPLRDDLISSRTQTLRGNYDLCKIISLTWGRGGICHPGLSFAPFERSGSWLTVGDAPGCLLIPASLSGCPVKFEEMPRNPRVCRMAFPREEIKTPSPRPRAAAMILTPRTLALTQRPTATRRGDCH